ncbi:uncharacterized protein LOC131938846 [Physella acuta]|uniref:uncharacterized protein LOC131938846 n=1 Tax=Physella acuta TaxID=109671 RepID=UPI0027DABB64|nr:uncharacterized protein LOC131938846 [Physella acuta]
MADVSSMLTCVVLVTSFIACWAKTLTPHGTCYIFHVPFINGYPRLLLVTVSTRPIKVNLTLTHQHGLSAVLTLQKAEVTIYDINPEFLFAESGLTNAFILESKEEFGARVVLTDSLRYPSMLASFNLVPSKGFGQLYYVSAISDKPAIVVVNGHKITFVTIALRGGSYSYSAGNSLLNDRLHMALLP